IPPTSRPPPNPMVRDTSGKVADVKLIQPLPACKLGMLPTTPTFPQTSQSPAVNDIDVTSANTLLLKDIAEPNAITLDANSPTLSNENDNAASCCVKFFI